MSLNVTEISVGEKTLTLRLTSRAIMNYCKKHGSEGGSPVIAVLEAVNNIEARADLLTAALGHPDNHNEVKDGYKLLDLMADSGSWDRHIINDTILELARQSGLLTDEDYLSLIDPVRENGEKLISTMARLLAGKPVEESSPDSQGDQAENPT